MNFDEIGSLGQVALQSRLISLRVVVRWDTLPMELYYLIQMRPFRFKLCI
jgi:hypothetical protein